jgi:hypothetical protein
METGKVTVTTVTVLTVMDDCHGQQELSCMLQSFYKTTIGWILKRETFFTLRGWG